MGDGRGMVVMSASGSAIVSSAADVLVMSVVSGVIPVYELVVCGNVYMFGSGRRMRRWGEWMR